MRTPESSVDAVYARAEGVRCGVSGCRSVPSFELYKCAREEELRCYRALCRVYVMHTGGVLTRPQRRILEDLQEELHISRARADLEWKGALTDSVVTGIAASGVLRTRENFFDGVKDISLEGPTNNNNNPQAAMLGDAQDDRATIYLPHAKVARTEQEMGAAGGGRSGVQQRNSATAVLKAVEKIVHDVSAIGNKLLHAVSPADRETYRKTLMMKRGKLQELLKDVEGNTGDISGSTSIMNSESVS